MGWKSLPITGKIFTAIIATALLVVLVMAASVAWSMREGYSMYVLSAEFNKTRSVRRQLVQDYDPAVGGWPMLDGTRRSWLNYTKKIMDRARPMPAPGLPELPGQQHGIDVFHIGARMVLQDANRRTIGGELPENVDWLEEALVIPDGPSAGQVVGYYLVYAPVQSKIRVSDIYLQGQIRTLAIAAAAALFLSSIAAYVLARFLVAPLRTLANSTETLAEGDYSKRLEISGRRDEVGRLMDSFNKLGESLEATARAERRWISDTSHEFKTPIAILRAEIEAIRDGVRQSNDTALTTLHTAVMRLNGLVQDLNDLSLAREGRLVVSLENEGLTAIVSAAVENTRGLIEEAGLTLETDLEPGITGRCDARRLSQTISNLLDNSRRYTAAPGLVRVTLKRGEGGLRISIEDSSPAPPEETLLLLFDRFYRVEQSRSRSFGGSGLGLAICRSIIEEHGGSIQTGHSEFGGLSVVILLPDQEARNAA